MTSLYFIYINNHTYFAIVCPSNAEFHQFDWGNRQQEEYSMNIDEAIQASEYEYQKLKVELNYSHEKLEEARNNCNIRQIQIEKLSQLAMPIEQDVTYIVRDISTKPKSSKINSSNRHNKVPGSSSAVNQEAINELCTKPSSSIYSKYVKDGEVYSLERNLEEITKRVASLTSSFMISLVQADDFSRSIIKDFQQEISQEKIQASTLSDEVDKLDYECFLSASELLRLRLSIFISQREELEEIAQLNREKDMYKIKEKELKDQLALDIHLVKQKVAAELQQIKSTFSGQFKSLDEKMKQLEKRQARVAKLKNDDKMKSLQHNIELSRDKYEKLKRRNVLELEGYQSEINLLTQRLKQLKLKQEQSQRLRSEKPRRLRGREDVIAHASNKNQTILSQLKSSMDRLS